MSDKKFAMFQLIGTVVGHPELGDAQRGDTLKLEVGDDGKPTSELLASRTRPVGKLITVGADDSEAVAEYIADAEAKVAKMLEAAKVEAAKLVQAGKDEAAGLVKTATEEANALREAANAEVSELMKAAGGGKK